MPSNMLRNTKKRREIRHRQREVARLYLRKMDQVEIAKKLKISQSTVSADLAFIDAQCLRDAIADVKQAKENALAEVRGLREEAYEAWLRSIGTRTKTRTVTKPGGVDKDGNPVEVVETTTERERLVGDPRFLAQMERCIDMECKILGAYAPTKLAGPDEGPIPIAIVKMAIDEL